MTGDVYALLAQANLLRMRGEWEAAALSCMTALRLAPDSSSANSLLGDIYENQGRYDDAAQWYLMALDVNPDSPADLLKLDRLRRREESERLQSASLPTRSVTAVLPPTYGLRHLARDPERALRVGAVAAALGLILVISFAYLAGHHAGTLGFGQEAVVKTKPVEVPPQAGALPTDPDAAPMHDPSEASLLTALQSVPALARQGITVYDVQADPRAGRMTVTFGLSASTGLTQAAVAGDALLVLQSAGSAPSQDTYTARCLLVTPGNPAGTALAFVGDATRDAVQASRPPAASSAGAALTDPQSLAAFSNVWWSATANIQA